MGQARLRGSREDRKKNPLGKRSNHIKTFHDLSRNKQQIISNDLAATVRTHSRGARPLRNKIMQTESRISKRLLDAMKGESQ